MCEHCDLRRQRVFEGEFYGSTDRHTTEPTQPGLFKPTELGFRFLNDLQEMFLAS